MNNKNLKLNEQRRRQTQFLDLVIEHRSVDAARQEMNLSNPEMHRWMEGDAFVARFLHVVETIEKLAEIETRVARAQAVRHLAEVAAGKVPETTPAQQQQACNTLVREGRLIARQPTRHDRPRSASTAPAVPDRYAQIHPSVPEPEKQRLWALLQQDIELAMENDHVPTIEDDETGRTAEPDHHAGAASAVDADLSRTAPAEVAHV